MSDLTKVVLTMTPNDLKANYDGPSTCPLARAIRRRVKQGTVVSVFADEFKLAEYDESVFGPNAYTGEVSWDHAAYQKATQRPLVKKVQRTVYIPTKYLK